MGLGYGVAWSPDGKRLATASDDQTAKVWDAASGQELLTLRGHGRLFRRSLEPRRQTAGHRQLDKTVKLWDAPSGQELLTLRGHSDLSMLWPIAPMASASPPPVRTKQSRYMPPTSTNCLSLLAVVSPASSLLTNASTTSSPKNARHCRIKIVISRVFAGGHVRFPPRRTKSGRLSD